MLNKLRIGTKLFLSFGIVIVLLLALAVVTTLSYWSIEKSTSNVMAMSDSMMTMSERMVVLFNRSQDINNAVDDANQMRRDFLFYLSTKEELENRRFDELLAKNKKSFTEIKASFTNPDNIENAETVLKTLESLQKRKSGFNSQEVIVAGIKDQCNTISGNVKKELEQLVWDIADVTKQTAVTNSEGKKVVEQEMMDLELLLLSSDVDVSQVLSDRDNFVNSTMDEDREHYKTQLLANMGKLKAKFEEVKPRMPPGDFATRFDTIMANRVTWEGIALNYVKNIEELRHQQEPLLEDIRTVIRVAGEILERTAGMVAEEGVNVKNEGDKVKLEGVAQDKVIVKAERTNYIVAIIAFLVAIVLMVMLSRSVSGGITGIVTIFHKITGEGDVSVTIDDVYLKRGDEVGDLAKQAQAIIDDFRSVTEMGQTVSQGDWTHKVRVKSDKDEMNQNLNRMVELVSGTLGEINDGVKQVATGAGEVTSAATSLSSGAQEAAASLEEITASMSEISSQTKQNAESAGQARDLAQKASKAATEGQNAMQSMTEAMKLITSNSNEIQRVIKVIDDIAFQTNLLALNAAVEAARAGQHGKGFAVVAEEVRNLASRSAKAARETSELIAKSGHEIEKGDGVATHTASVLNTIVDQIKQTTDLVAGIAHASNEQAQGVNHVSIGLQQIDSVTQQNTAAAEESASAANEMSGMATNLQKLVAQFKLR